MSKLLIKLNKQISDLEKQTEAHRDIFSKSRNFPLEHDCPKCSAIKSKDCKTPSGKDTFNSHRERIALTIKDVEAYNKIRNEWQIKLNDMNRQLNTLLDKRRTIEDGIKKVESEKNRVAAIKKFNQSFKGIRKLPNAEVVLEVGRDGILVVRSHNLAQLVPGDMLPGREVLSTLSKKGVDIVMTKPSSYFNMNGPATWYWQTPRW